MSKGTGATPAMTWKSGVLAVILLLGIIGPLLIVSWMWGGPGFCPAVPMMSQMENINDKMSKPNPDGGADLMWGTGICTIYLRPYDPDDENHLVESDSNSFGVKIVMHEYIHCLQQGLVSGDVDPAVRFDTIDVTVENKCGIDDVYASKTIAAFADLPAEFRLVKKVVVFYACGNGYEYTQAEIEEKVYGAGCPGMDPMRSPGRNLNGFGEGDAEYYAMNTIMPAVVTGWTTPYNGPNEWTQKNTECKQRCGLPGNAAFKIGDMGEDSVDNKMIREMQDAGYDDCRNNCIGELVIKFLLDRRPATTIADILNIWKGSGSVGFGASWEAQIGESWQDFSKALERDPNYTNDPSSEGTPGQAKGSEYDLSDDMPAMFGGFTFVGVFVSFCCLVKLGLMARSLLTSRRAGQESISAV